MCIVLLPPGVNPIAVNKYKYFLNDYVDGVTTEKNEKLAFYGMQNVDI